MNNIYGSIEQWAAIYGLSIVGALIILIVGFLISKSLRKIAVKLLQKSKLDAAVISFLGNVVYGLFITFVLLMALGELGVETTSFIAVLGAAGLAVGLALKDSLQNFAAGVMILGNKQFTIGHYVEAGGAAGTVDEIRLFHTKLKTPDNRVIYIPNSNIINNNITNFSSEATRRCDLEFGIGYNDDIDKAKQIILQLLSSDNRVLTETPPQIIVGSLGDSSVNIKVRAWVKKEDYWDFFFDMTENVKKKFDQEGVSIPFPQRDVHLFQQPAN